MVIFGQCIPIVGVGDFKVVLVYPPEDKPARVFKLTHVLRVPVMKGNLFALLVMESNRVSFHWRNSEISLFGVEVIFPVVGNLHEMSGFPLT